MDKSTHEVRLSWWKDIVSKCQARPEGQTAKSWLAENGIQVKQYYYWLRQIRKEAYEEMKAKSLPAATSDDDNVTFAEIPLCSGNTRNDQPATNTADFRADAMIRLGSATIAVSNTASGQLLNGIIEAVSHAR